MKCKNCGKANPEGARFCGYCQSELVKEKKRVSKILIGSIGIALCILLCLILSMKNNHTHSWKPATCESPMVCEICGETSGTPLPHRWRDATCLEPRTCKICGITTGDVSYHKWSAPTCLAPMTCEVCGTTYGLPAEHSWIAATTDTPKTCKVCGKTTGAVLTRKPILSEDDHIAFGLFEQDGDSNNGKEAIEWLVLDVQDNRALLLSKNALISQPYNREYEAVDWENCTLRRWLNNTFFKVSFNESQRKAILEVTVNNSVLEGNQEWEITGGKNTQDHAFLLSYKEVMQYFSRPEERICTPTPNAIKMGADTRKYNDKITEACWWWLRSPGEKEHYAAFVNYDGEIYSNAVGNEYLSVRPAMWVDLDNLKTLDYEIIEQENVPFTAMTSAIRDNLPIVTYAMTLSEKVYSYSDSTLTKKTNDFYFKARKDEIVILDVSDDGAALYIRYPSSISGTGYNDRWFSAKDILGSVEPDVYTFKASQKSTTGRIINETMLALYGKFFEGQICKNLGIHKTGDRVVLYPLTSAQAFMDITVGHQLALVSS